MAQDLHFQNAVIEIHRLLEIANLEHPVQRAPKLSFVHLYNRNTELLEDSACGRGVSE